MGLTKKENHLIHTRCFTSDLTEAKILEKENKDIATFINIISDIISHNYNIHDLCYNLTKEFVKFTECRYGYFCEIKEKDRIPQYYSKTIIDTVGENLYENTLKNCPDGLYFPLTEDTRNKAWARSYFEKKPIIDNNLDNLPIRGCPVTQFSNFYSTRLIFRGENVGVIALAGREEDFTEHFDKTYRPIINIMANMVWSRKILIENEKILKENETSRLKLEQEKSSELYEKFTSVSRNNSELRNQFDSKMELLNSKNQYIYLDFY